MPLEGESSIPKKTQDAWVQTWKHNFQIHQTAPEHVRARIALEKSIWNAGENLPLQADTFFHRRVQAAKSNVMAISKEWGLAEHVNLVVKQIPEMFLRISPGSELTRSDVVRIMSYEKIADGPDDKYQALEEGVMQQIRRRESKASQKRK